MAAPYIFCMVPHSTKAEAVKKAVLGEIRETLPASILRLHTNAKLYLDGSSAALMLDAMA